MSPNTTKIRESVTTLLENKGHNLEEARFIAGIIDDYYSVPLNFSPVSAILHAEEQFITTPTRLQIATDAMQGLVAGGGKRPVAEFVQEAFKIADAMIEAAKELKDPNAN